MRHLRRLAASQGYVRAVEVTRMSVDSRTGEVRLRRRKVRRKHRYLANQTHGYLAVNDGVRAAYDIARLLSPAEPRRSEFRLVS